MFTTRASDSLLSEIPNYGRVWLTNNLPRSQDIQVFGVPGVVAVEVAHRVVKGCQEIYQPFSSSKLTEFTNP